MRVINQETWNWERNNLGITANDLNEFDDPLDNILLDVMFDSFYNIIRQKHSNSEE